MHLAYSAAIFLSFWLLGGFPFLDGLVRGTGVGEIGAGLLFFGILVAGGSVPRERSAPKSEE